MPLPVVVVSSEAGPRTTRTLYQLAQGAAAAHTVAVLPDPGAGPADAPGLRILPTAAEHLRLGEGCACCTVRGDLLERIRALATDGRTDRILVHAHPSDDLSVIAKTFTVADAAGRRLEPSAWVDALVVTTSVDELVGPGGAARALVERIELATVVHIEPGAASDPQRATAARIAHALNPAARVTWADAGALVAGEAAGDARFDLDAARSRATLGDVLDGDETRAGAGVMRLVFQARRPFHAERLHAWLSAPPPGLLRGRGGFWVATRPHIAATLDLAGSDARTDMEGHWWAAVPESEHPSGPDWDRYVAGIWDFTFGDRRQELAFVGTDLDESALRAGLEACLLTAEELSRPGAWANQAHPFPWAPAVTA